MSAHVPAEPESGVRGAGPRPALVSQSQSPETGPRPRCRALLGAGRRGVARSGRGCVRGAGPAEKKWGPSRCALTRSSRPGQGTAAGVARGRDSGAACWAPPCKATLSSVGDGHAGETRSGRADRVSPRRRATALGPTGGPVYDRRHRDACQAATFCPLSVSTGPRRCCARARCPSRLALRCRSGPRPRVVSSGE